MALYAFDGTDQDAHQQLPSKYTNVTLFRDVYDGPSETFYFSGPGTRLGILGRVLGVGAGVGSQTRLKEAYQKLRQAFRQGDRTVDIIGYSRGAANALVFCWFLSQRRVADELGERPRIRFLGLWDTVIFNMNLVGLPLKQRLKAFFGNNKAAGRLWGKTGGADLDLPPTVEKAFHAMALQEERRTFLPLRVKRAHEVWFAGVHSDVGGGSPCRELSELSRHWMIEKAMACGLPFKEGARARSKTAGGCEQTLQWGGWVRDIRKGDLVHSSVLPLAGASQHTLLDLGVKEED